MNKKVFPLLLILLLLGVSLGGCSFLNDLRLFRSEAAQEESTPQLDVSEKGLGLEAPETDGQTQGQTQGQTPEEKSSSAGSVAPADPALSAEVKEVLLYFADADGQNLATETRSIPRQTGLARATVGELIAGPQSASLSPTLPAGAIVEGMNIADGICTVDFSGEFKEQMPADAQSQLLAVYSLVNTLTQFDTVDKVRILVDGELISGGLGGVDLSAALAPVTL